MYCEWCGKKSKRLGLCKECFFKVKCMVPTLRVKNIHELKQIVNRIENRYLGFYKEIEETIKDLTKYDC